MKTMQIGSSTLRQALSLAKKLKPESLNVAQDSDGWLVLAMKCEKAGGANIPLIKVENVEDAKEASIRIGVSLKLERFEDILPDVTNTRGERVSEIFSRMVIGVMKGEGEFDPSIAEQMFKANPVYAITNLAPIGVIRVNGEWVKEER